MGLAYVRIWIPNFLGSSKVRQLSGLARGLYLLCLVHEADFDGAGLPADEESLRSLCTVDPDDWARLWPRLRPFFVERNGRLFNDRMEREIAESMKFRNSQAAAGRASGSARREAAAARSRARQELNRGSTLSSNDGSTMVQFRLNDGSTTVEPKLNPPSPSPSPSPSPTTTPEPAGGGVGNEIDPAWNGAEARVFERLQFEFHLGAPKAAGLMERLHPDMASLDAWSTAFKSCKDKDRRLLTHWLQRVRLPSEIPGSAANAEAKKDSELVRKLLAGELPNVD